MEFTYTKEKSGIAHRAISDFEHQIKEKRVNLHSFIMLQGKNILAEKYYEPYGKDMQHRMYSIAKSFTALAVGLLADEGKITLDDEICGYFREKQPTIVDERLQSMTIRDMLRMTTAHKSTTYKRYDGDWTESFFRVEPSHEAGCVFCYDTSAPHTLSALVEKLTGKKMLDYLREKCLDKLGFSREAYMLQDSSGVSQGGSGLVCTPLDIAKVAYLCNHNGVVDGEQLYPAWFLEEATAKQIGTSLQPHLDEQYGYGYYFWRTRDNKGFCMYGMGGQLALCFPKEDFILVTTADMQGAGAGLQTLYDAFYDTVGKELFAADEGNVQKDHSKVPADMLGKKILFRENPMGLCWARIEADRFLYENQNGSFAIPFSFDGYTEYEFPDQTELSRTFEASASGAMARTTARMEGGQLLLRTYLYGVHQSNFWIEIGKKGSCVTVHMKRAAENFLNHYDGFAGGRMMED